MERNRELIVLAGESESLRIKEQAKQNIIKELSGRLTSEQIKKFSNIFDDVAKGYIFTKKQ